MTEKYVETGHHTGKNRKPLIMGIVAACCVLAAIAAVALIRQGNFRRDYDRAAALREAGKYGEAAAAFQAMGNYADAPAQALETRYEQGLALLASGDRQVAAAVLAMVSGYKDADELIREALAPESSPEEPEKEEEDAPVSYLPLSLALFYRQTYSAGGLLTADGVTKTATMSIARTDGYILGGQTFTVPDGYSIRRYYAYDRDEDLAFITQAPVNSQSVDLPETLTVEGREYTSVAYRLTVCAMPYSSKAVLDIDRMLGGFVPAPAPAEQTEEKAETEIQWVLPDEIYGVIGHPFSIHYYDILQLDSLEGWHVWVSGSKEMWEHAGNYGNRLRFACDETEASDYTFTLCLRKDSRETVSKRKVTVHILPENIPQVRAVFIGDSLTDDGAYLAELMRLCGDKLTLYGTMDFVREDSDGVTRSGLDEGRAGWSLGEYCTKEKITGQAGDMVNPFFNSEKAGESQFDFTYYMDHHPEFRDVTDVFIFSGPNDMRNETFRTYYQAIADSVKEYDPAVRVHCVMPSTIVGRTGTAWNGAEEFRYGMMDLGRTILDMFEHREGFSVVPAHVNLDHEYDIALITGAATDRNPAPVWVSAEKVHLNDYGYYSVADMIFADIIANCR